MPIKEISPTKQTTNNFDKFDLKKWWNSFPNCSDSEKIEIIKNYKIGEYYKHISVTDNEDNDLIPDKIHIGVFGRPGQGKSSFVKSILSIILKTTFHDIRYFIIIIFLVLEIIFNLVQRIFCVTN
jgi:hypothetical protein